MSTCDPKKVPVSVLPSVPVASYEAPKTILPIHKLNRYSSFTDGLLHELLRNQLKDNAYNIKDPDFIDKSYRVVAQQLNAMRSKDLTYEGLPSWFKSEQDFFSARTNVEILKLLQNWGQFVDFHRASSNLYNFITESYNDVEDQVMDFEEENLNKEDVGEKFWDAASNSEDVYKQSENNIKILFSNLFKSEYDAINKKAIILKDADNLPYAADPLVIYNLLISKVNGVRSEEEFIDSLKSEELLNIVPELKHITDTIGIDNIENINNSQSQLFIQLYNVFSNPEVQYKILNMFPKMELYPDQYGNMVLTPSNKIKNVESSDEIRGNSKQVLNQWKNNFENRMIGDTKIKVGNKPGQISVSASGKSLFTKNNLIESIGNFEDAISFLNNLGFEFSTKNWGQKQYAKNSEILITAAKYIHKALTEAFEYDENLELRDPFNEIRKGLPGQNRKIFAGYRSLSKLHRLEQKYSTLIPSNSSINAGGEKVYLINNKNNITEVTGTLNKTKSLNEVFTKDLFAKLNTNPIFKASLILSKLFNTQGFRTNIQYKPTLLSGLVINGKGQTISDMTDKMKLIMDFHAMIKYGTTDVMRTGTSNSFFANVLSIDDKPIHLFDYNEFEQGVLFSNKVQNQYIKYLNTELERIQSYKQKKKENPDLTEKYKDFSIFSFLTEELKDKLRVLDSIQLDSEIGKEFIIEVNTKLHSEILNYRNLLISNGVDINNELLSLDLIEKYPGYKKNDEGTEVKVDVFQNLTRMFIVNTHMQNIEFSTLFSGDPLFYSAMYKRLQGLSSTGTYVNTGNVANNLVNNHEYNNNSLAYHLNVERRDNSKTFLTKTVKDVTSDEIKDFAYKELKSKITDGWSIMNIDYAHEIFTRNGVMTPEMEEGFKYEIYVYRKYIAKQKLSPLEEAEFKKLEEKLIKDPNLYSISGIKAGYFGNLNNQNIDAKVYDKTHFTVLLPSKVMGKPKLEKLLKDMVSNQLAYVKHTSATKGYAQNVSDINDLSKPDEQFTSLFKIQIKFKTDQNTDTSIPTQLSKLISSNLFSSGEALDKFKEGNKQYIESLRKITDNKIDKLLEDFGLIGNNINWRNVSEMLLKEAIRGNMNSNVIESFRLNPDTGTLYGSPEIGITREIEKIITSLVHRELVKFKFNGGDFILSSNGYSNRLKIYQKTKDGVTKAEIRKTFSKEDKKLLELEHRDGQRIGTIFRLNEMLQDEKFIKKNEDALSMVMVRIPTQEMNSIDIGIVKEFLHPTMGSVVELPEEILIKTGADFDFDKVKLLSPFLDRNGKVIKFKETKEELEKQLDDLENNKTQISGVEDQISYTHAQIQSIEKQLFEKDLNSLKSLAFQIKDNTNKEEYDQLEEEQRLLQDELFRLRDNLETLVGGKQIKIENIINSEKYKEFTTYFNRVNEIKNKQRNLFKNEVNKMLMNWQNMILSPERFDNFMKPNSVDELKRIAKIIQDKLNLPKSNTEGLAYMPQLGDNLLYSANMYAFSAFLNSKRMLAYFAKMNTLQQVFAYTGVKLNRELQKVWSPTSIYEYTINLPLLTKAEEDEAIQDGKLDIGRNTDIIGNLLQIINSEAINSTADAGNDPYFAMLGINKKNIASVILLNSIFKVPLERVIKLINTKEIKKYNDMLMGGKSKEEANLFLIRAFDIRWGNIELPVRKIKNQPSFPEVIRAFENRDTEYFNKYQIFIKDHDIRNLMNLKRLHMSDLDEALTKSVKESNYLGNPTGIARRFIMISSYINTDNINYAFRNITFYLNSDTKKVGSLVDLQRKRELRNEILQSKIISEEDLIKLEKETSIGQFDTSPVLDRLFSIFAPVLNKSLTGLYNIYNDYNTNWDVRTSQGVRAIPRLITSDFMYSIVKNFGEKANHGQQLLFSEDLTNRLNEFKTNSKYKDVLSRFPVLRNLVVYKNYFNNDEEVVNNIKLNKSIDPTVSEINSYIHQFNKLLGPDKIIEDSKENEKIKQLFKDIADVALAQTGFSSSEFSFQDMIPHSYYQEDFNQSYNKFLQYSNNEEFISDYISNFKDQFEKQNKRYFPKLKNKRGKFTIQNNNEIEFNFKNYSYTFEENISSNMKVSNNEIYKQLGDFTKSENVKIVGQDGIPNFYKKGGGTNWEEIKEYAKKNGMIYSLRMNNNTNFGNIFDSKNTRGTIRTKSTQESVEKYIDWVTDPKFDYSSYSITKEEKQKFIEKADWIRQQLKSGVLKGKPILYYTELNEPSHATALDWLLNSENSPFNKTLETSNIKYSQPFIDDLISKNIITFTDENGKPCK